MATFLLPLPYFQPSHPNHTSCCCSLTPSIPTLTSRFLSLRKNPKPEFHSFPAPKSTLKTDPLVPNAKEETVAETNQQVPLKNAQKTKITSSSSFTETLVSIFHGFRNVLEFDELGLEILSIALPAVLAIAADPITLLVDSAYIGHVGSVELAAVGVSISVFNLVAKLFNIPLLNVTTSFVAEEQAKISDRDYSSITVDTSDSNLRFASESQEPMHDKQSKEFLPAVSASLALAAGVGIAEAVALLIGSGSLMNIMGVPVDSPMRLPAEQFLTLRAFGAPAIVIALAAQGTFRGFMDTKTPLYAVGAGNLLNAILDPIFIFSFGLGVGGAAISTVISEYLTAFILMWKLNSKVILIPENIDGKGIARYLQSGSLLIGRTIAVLMTMTLGTSMAARQGHIAMAAHQICLQVWFALSLLTDALALAGQALLARSYTQGEYKQAQRVIYRILQLGGVIGFTLAVILFLGFGAFSHLFSTDSDVLDLAYAEILFVAGSQPVVSVAFVFDGLYYGVSDFAFAAYSMVVAGLVSSVFLLVAAPIFRLDGVWAGLCLFMILRVVAGVWRLGMKDGPWKVIWSETEMELLDK